ncbi:alkaline shock response membrane anchor protein AmaP [Streptomyces sp. NPDC005385]|uniref:alkaline shock response membrane anchor protein AmaP n=1 Tax=Streptomyces sp. NPDC005385 TaxID=3157039 RepID=UPI0033AC171E
MNKQSLTNRILLALTGLVLSAGGLLVLFGSLDLYRHWHITPPDSWPVTTPHAVLLATADRTRWSGEGWWWPVLIAGLTVVVLLGLWWLISQLHRPRLRRTAIGGTPPAEGVELHGRALGDALAADAGQLPGVEQAKVHITGPPGHPQSRITLTLTPGSEPGTILQALSDGPLERTRLVTGWPLLPTRTTLQSHHRKPRRAV